MTTMTHTALGDRWIYDGCHDPVYVMALVRTILTGGREADLYAATDEGLVLEPATTQVRGSGSLPSASIPALTSPVVGHNGTTTTIDTGLRLTLPRVVLTTTPAANAVLNGIWPGQETAVVLATVDGLCQPEARAALTRTAGGMSGCASPASGPGPGPGRVCLPRRLGESRIDRE